MTPALRKIGRNFAVALMAHLAVAAAVLGLGVDWGSYTAPEDRGVIEIDWPTVQ